jgi:hypothetical protein
MRIVGGLWPSCALIRIVVWAAACADNVNITVSLPRRRLFISERVAITLPR